MPWLAKNVRSEKNPVANQGIDAYVQAGDTTGGMEISPG